MTYDQIMTMAKAYGFSLYSMHDVDGQDLGESVEADSFGVLYNFAAAIAAAEREACAQQSPWCMKMNGCKTKCEDCPDEAAQPQHEPVALRWLVEMIMSDCGCSSNNQRLFERLTARISQYERANTSPPAQQSPWCMKMNGCKTKCEDCPDEAPKQRKPMTESEIYKAINDWVGDIDPEDEPSALDIFRAAEAAHGIK